MSKSKSSKARKTAKAAKPAKKVAKKVAKRPAPKKAASKKPAKKAAKPAGKAVKKTVRKAAPGKAVKKKVAPKAKAASRARGPAGKAAPRIQKAVVTTVLPPKLSAAAPAPKAGLPAQAAVKAPKAPQAKIAAAAAEKPTRKRLNKEELKYFEKLLNEKKETLLQEQSYLEDNALRLNSKDGAGDLSSHAYHLADHATETQDREQAFHLASREGRFLFYIEEALDRVRNGTFGICKKCGTLIPKARLEAVPTAKMCINCKSQQEHAVDVEPVPA